MSARVVCVWRETAAARRRLQTAGPPAGRGRGRRGRGGSKKKKKRPSLPDRRCTCVRGYVVSCTAKPPSRLGPEHCVVLVAPLPHRLVRCGQVLPRRGRPTGPVAPGARRGAGVLCRSSCSATRDLRYVVVDIWYDGTIYGFWRRGHVTSRHVLPREETRLASWRGGGVVGWGAGEGTRGGPRRAAAPRSTALRCRPTHRTHRPIR